MNRFKWRKRRIEFRLSLDIRIQRANEPLSIHIPPFNSRPFEHVNIEPTSSTRNRILRANPSGKVDRLHANRPRPRPAAPMRRPTARIRGALPRPHSKPGRSLAALCATRRSSLPHANANQTALSHLSSHC